MILIECVVIQFHSHSGKQNDGNEQPQRKGNYLDDGGVLSADDILYSIINGFHISLFFVFSPLSTRSFTEFVIAIRKETFNYQLSTIN